MTAARRFDAVVFDLLTALLDSWSLWNGVAGSPEAGRRWRQTYLRLTYSAGRYRPYEQVVREAAREAGFDERWADDLIRRWEELQPWPEVPAVLPTLAQRVPLAIATNCSRRLGLLAAQRAGGPFAAVVTAEQCGFYKPRPEPYRAVLDHLGTDPARTLFVAGSAADVPGARSVGMPVYWHNRMHLAPVDEAVPERSEDTLYPLLQYLR